MGKRRASDTRSTPRQKKSKGIEYEVEKVLDKRELRGKTEYRLSWKGFSEQHNSWEPLENCGKCKVLIADYERRVKEEKNPNDDDVTNNNQVVDPDPPAPILEVATDHEPGDLEQPATLKEEVPIGAMTSNTCPEPILKEEEAATLKTTEKQSQASETTTTTTSLVSETAAAVTTESSSPSTMTTVAPEGEDVHVNGIVEKQTEEMEETAAVIVPFSSSSATLATST